MPLENTPLKYLFTAIYDDGTTCCQTPEDVSTVDPTRSAYYDVANSGKKVVAMVLRSLDGEVQAAVSLEDGHFEMNGTAFFVGDIPNYPGDPELIYLRRNFRNFNIEMDQQAHVIHYYIGWRIGDVERTIGIL